MTEGLDPDDIRLWRQWRLLEAFPGYGTFEALEQTKASRLLRVYEMRMLEAEARADKQG